MHRFDRFVWRTRWCAACLLTGATVSALAAGGQPWSGPWRVTLATPAPWLGGAGVTDTRAWLGAELRFDAEAVAGPGVLSCGGARYEALRSPAEGLFQGGLPAPAVKAAERLGIAAGPVEGLRLTCDTGVFDFHRVDADTLLVGVDNVVWTLDRSPGARAAPDSPEGVVQELLEAHFAGDMAFVPDAVAEKRRWLGRDLWVEVQTYLARAQAPDRPPPIEGDPFTDSQEYPTRFSVGAADAADAAASVPVRFADGHRSRTVVYRLVRENEHWRVEDLLYEDGSRLSDWLR